VGVSINTVRTMEACGSEPVVSFASTRDRREALEGMGIEFLKSWFARGAVSCGPSRGAVSCGPLGRNKPYRPRGAKENPSSGVAGRA